MCDVNPPVSQGRLPKRNNHICHKCNVAKPTLKSRHTYYCQPCFEVAFGNKFRAQVGKALKLSPRRKPRVFLALSGGTSSRALLDLVYNFSKLDYPTANNQKFEKFIVCHINESALFPNSTGNADILRGMVEAYDGPTYDEVPLESAFHVGDTESNDSIPAPLLRINEGSSYVDSEYLFTLSRSEESFRAKLQALFAATKKLTAKEELLADLRTSLLLQRARQHGCELVFLGDTCTRLAIRVIALTSRGRGYSLPVELGDGSQWFKEVVTPPSFTTGLPVKASIDRLTEDFIVGLDRDFPSTTSAVTRTAAKLTPRDGLDLRKQCLLCLMPVETDIPQWKSDITVRTNTDSQSTKDAQGPSSPSTLNLTSHLCYACQNTLSELAPGVDLPTLVPPTYFEETIAGLGQLGLTEEHGTGGALMSSEAMKASIQDFLLDD
ncbi:hypothetical protein BJ085DRAFT_29496 [Dimargaris cristalligena]|uniref:Cytoplasmic tRNA 2-thiolation protein 2 n=1 Tax=Dimargaris cristalligena TaxID=215637 RepID=A0A4P9ZXM0_9FUNG|nr:hypothetical protein BJ085DRAFT_29496 [Dimargaris cristalligena]|eukprot:RKP37480.1 hypothetical protein BJ085DRAFT_29496 [Dimargaris cristalligena]